MAQNGALRKGEFSTAGCARLTTLVCLHKDIPGSTIFLLTSTTLSRNGSLNVPQVLMQSMWRKFVLSSKS